MKFAHLADCHLGGWRDPKLRALTDKAFIAAISGIIEERVDFVLIAGDLFHTSLPGFESMRVAVQQLKRLTAEGISTYAIPGSHDYSPSGKTMIDVFEDAGLLTNVFKGSAADGALNLTFTTDKKTGAKITGIPGLRGMLDREQYSQLAHPHLEDEKGYKIFMAHTALRDLMDDSFAGIDAMDISVLPKGMDYYACGHIHAAKTYSHQDYPLAVYPGPLFPNSFRELELLMHGSYALVEDGSVKIIPINVITARSIALDCSGMTPEEVEAGIREEGGDVKGAIVMIRLFGTLASGRPADIDYKGIVRDLYASGAYFVMKNVMKLSTEEFDEIKTDRRSVAEIEDAFLADFSKEDARQAKDLLAALSKEKGEGEKTSDYERRIFEDAEKILD